MVLRQLGVTSKHKGYYYLAEAVRIRIRSQRPYYITKELYPALARQFGIKESAVDSGIRRLSRYCWEHHRDLLIHMAGYTLEQPPTNQQFIEIVAFCVLVS